MEEEEVAEVLTVQAERGRGHIKIVSNRRVNWKTSLRMFRFFITKSQSESYW